MVDVKILIYPFKAFFKVPEDILIAVKEIAHYSITESEAFLENSTIIFKSFGFCEASSLHFFLNT